MEVMSIAPDEEMMIIRTGGHGVRRTNGEK